MLGKYKTFYCPVCDAPLGTHDKTKLVICHCDECKVKFFWKPGKTKPESLLDKDIPKSCGCGICNR